VFELPLASLVATMGANVDPAFVAKQPPGVWFDEPVEESCIASSRYEMEFAILHLGTQSARAWISEAPDDEDSLDRFNRWAAPQCLRTKNHALAPYRTIPNWGPAGASSRLGQGE
jgi:hypothetical protein